ncbi:hypothetical protein [Maribacter sp.]|uniref:hypothetical protein n=1 Tax=Maribacter sp. TaxID=1897614 RepID=UPI003C74126F
MKNKQNDLKGTVQRIPENQIYLNINHLNDGTYVLKIIHKNKVIKETSFKKKK